ncbi:MAG: hypothetical protein ABI850_01270 [Flavobacterium sp.]
MRKYLFLICAAAFASCSTEESSSESQIVQKNEANFTLSKNIERADWSNIQTGELLKIDIKIKDFDTDPDVVYVLKPITADASKHQRNKLDYDFQEEIKIPDPAIFPGVKDSILTKKTRDSIIIKKANSFFFISVLKPGNFSHQYQLRKMRDKKYVGGTVQDLLFSAVKLDIYTWNEQTDNSTMFANSKHSRYYEFTIDDGEQTNDTYLTDTETKKHTYTTLYNDKTFSGNVIIKQALTFSPKVNTEKGAQIIPKPNLTELKIIQKRTGDLDNIIIYNDLKITQKY